MFGTIVFLPKIFPYTTLLSSFRGVLSWVSRTNESMLWIKDPKSNISGYKMVARILHRRVLISPGTRACNAFW